jgi:predicted SAM-dependent methyltransferase
MTLKNMLYQLKKEVFYRNTLLRKIYTKNYSVKKVAIGETKDHHFPRDWQRVDYSNADYDIDLNSSYVLPFESDTIEMMYSAHCMEHLKEERAQYLLEESYRVMANGGVIRIEVPDVTRIIECYKKRTPEYLDHFDKRYSYMCDN